MLENPLYKKLFEKNKLLTPQKPMSLRRYTKEMKSVVPNDYIVFFLEYEVDIRAIENDPINFNQAMESSNSQM